MPRHTRLFCQVCFGMFALFAATSPFAVNANPPAPLPSASSAPAGYIEIPAGSFIMGSPTDEKGRHKGETQHAVTITRAFFLKETEVTQGEWEALMGNNPSHPGESGEAMGYNPSDFSSCGSDCPVDTVSWYDALAYCNALSKKEGLTSCYDLSECIGEPGIGGYICFGILDFDFSCNGYRLPTEAEWEYAYRAGTTSAFYNGDISEPDGKDPNLDKIGWYDENADDTNHPVKGKQPNAWGLYDMSGNVYEWCWDSDDPYPSDPQSDPKGSYRASYRVFRGGSWSFRAELTRAAHRSSLGPGFRSFYVGFRPARSKH